MTTHRTSITFHAANADDTAAFTELRGKTRQNAVSQERLAEVGITADSWAEMMRSGNLPGHVCHRDGQLAGYCFGDRDTGEIVVLALLPDCEGLGIGKTLLARVMAELRAQGHARLFLGCSNDPSSRSYGFYRYLGWTATGETDKYGDDVLEFRFAA
ncbi:GNAT family N-acetyltransferase [Janthinobacterium sp. 1_2014MBL_MicDiv]|uniref:GNAT family N-acetyltransferase n=1 Tax=Janthinobacterium sp. 1_2014MBL_MicDiv TaxID=1644131 RepID=UPI0008F50595|nr:GNAT family N-acetyltransferase [Janthinobacterium sp. 1_2014MBL_MicDiv]APA69471.1 acetyltransferase [Janthinobacterium sp. 1_2014MBL_MicDiv]